MVGSGEYSFYSDKTGYTTQYITEVEPSDINEMTDEYITSIDICGGIWHIYRLPSGDFVGYFELDI